MGQVFGRKPSNLMLRPKFKPEYLISESNFTLKIEKFSSFRRYEIFECSDVTFKEIDMCWSVSLISFNPKISPSCCRVVFRIRTDNDEIWKSKLFSFEVLGKASDVNFFTSGFVKIDSPVMLVESHSSSKSMENFLSPDDSFILNLLIVVKFSGKGQDRIKYMSPSYLNQKVQQQISNTMRYADFTFTVRNRIFKVHRNILAAASPVFTKMFITKMKEGIHQQCTIDFIEPEVFEQLIHFIYNGEITKDLGSMWMDLYEAAHFFDISLLEDIAKEGVHENLTMENAFEVLNWAELFELTSLKNEACEIVKRKILKVGFLKPAEQPLTSNEIQEVENIINSGRIKDEIEITFAVMKLNS